MMMMMMNITVAAMCTVYADTNICMVHYTLCSSRLQ